MMTRTTWCVAAAVMSAAACLLGAGGNTPFEPDERVVYKKVGDVELALHMFKPKPPRDKAPAVVFFFGGGWSSGSPSQFYPHCAHLAEHGFVAMAADYRVKSRHGVAPIDCVRDAKSAVRWIRAHAQELGVDPKAVLAGGGSAGGHLAACTGCIDGFDEPDEDASASSKPTALLLFNPAVNPAGSLRMKLRFGEHAEALSPLRHVTSSAPPAIIFHGKEDTTVPYADVEQFAEKMHEAGVRCELVGFEGKGHGFFNYSRDRAAYDATIEAMDRFLEELGYIKPAKQQETAP